MQQLKKIVAIGPESTGKSTLCEILAAHYNTLWCPEYAREYLLKHGTNYSFNDLETIARGQVRIEETFSLKMSTVNRQPLTDYGQRSTVNGQLLFIDTDMYVMKVWCEYVFGKCHHFILEEIAARKYDLYLLCNTDLPWVADELREYPNEKNRIELFHIYKDILSQQDTPWVEIKGNNEQRFAMAAEAIERLFITQ